MSEAPRDAGSALDDDAVRARCAAIVRRGLARQRAAQAAARLAQAPVEDQDDGPDDAA